MSPSAHAQLKDPLASQPPVAITLSCAALFVFGFLMLAVAVRSAGPKARRTRLSFLGIGAMVLGIAACIAALAALPS